MDSEGYSAGTSAWQLRLCLVLWQGQDTTDTEFLRKDAKMKQQPVSLESFQYKTI